MKFLVSIGAFLFSGLLAAAPIQNVVIFGDSLSDNGNLYRLMNHQLPQSPPYFEGRFSNGPVWIEYLIASYFSENSESHLLNYAFGGAGVSEKEDDDGLLTLSKEMANYLSNYEVNQETLYILWIGANNYLGMPVDKDEVLNEVNLGITHSLEMLVNKGAKHILVLNLPDLGRTPAASELDLEEGFAYFTKQHNALLDRTMVSLKKKHPGVNWLYFDIGKAFNEVIDMPENFGLSDVKNTCVNFDASATTKKSILNMVAHAQPTRNNETCDGYLFFDLVHPTTFAHKVLAEKAIEMLNNSKVEFATNS